MPEDPQAYVEQVMAEIAEEVRLRRASGDLPPRLERELDELFLAHSPDRRARGRPGRGAAQVDAATFIDPVVPVESERAAGAFVKKGMRSLLHVVRRVGHPPDEPVGLGREPGPAHRRRPAQGARARRSRPSRCPRPAWSSSPTLIGPGRLVGRAGAGRPGQGAGPRAARRLRRRLAGAPAERGRACDAYGVDPRSAAGGPGRAGRAGPAGRGRGRPPAGGGGVGPGRRGAERDGRGHGRRRADAAAGAIVASRLAPGGTLVIHSVTRATWESADAPFEADLAPGTAAAGRDLVPACWSRAATTAIARCRARRAPTSSSPRCGPTSPLRRRSAGPVSAAAGRAGGRPPVHRPPSTRTTPPGTHTLRAARRAAPGGVALGDLRRGDPRRPGRRGVQALDVPRARGRRRRRHVPVHDLVGRGRVPGRAGAAR